MSHIPNSAIPHAAPQTETETIKRDAGRPSLSERAGKLKDKARDNPKTAVAAGVAVVGAAIAAAAIPLVRAKSKTGAKKSTTTKSKPAAKKPS